MKVAIERKKNKKKTELKVIKISCLRLVFKFHSNALVIFITLGEGLGTFQIYERWET